MKLIDQPARFNIPFANAAGPGFVRPIPQASQISITPGAASLTDGFPPLNFLPVAGGGVPPFGQDMNGVLNQISAWARWQAAGGTSHYNASFSTAIGGYPKGAVVLLDQGEFLVKSTVDDNTQDPNVALTNWEVLGDVWSNTVWPAGGTANALTVTMTSPPLALTQLLNVPIWFRASANNTGAATLNVNGLGVRAIQDTNGHPLGGAALVNGQAYCVLYNGTAFQVMSLLKVLGDATGQGGLIIDGSGVGTGALVLIGGGATPRKYLRSNAGHFSIVNAAYTAEILNLSDTGDLVIPGQVSANFLTSGAGGILTSGNIHTTAGLTVDNGATISNGLNVASGNMQTANGSIAAGNGNVTAGLRLRAVLGAYASGDLNAAVLLADFTFNGAYRVEPDGFIWQYGNTSLNGDFTVPEYFPIAFPHACLGVVCTEGAAGGGWAAGNTSPTIHGVSGWNNAYWLHAGAGWDVPTKTWGTRNLTTSYLAWGY